MYLGGVCVAFLYIEVTEFKRGVGFERRHWWKRRHVLFGPWRPCAEFEVKWCEPEPEGSRYVIGVVHEDGWVDEQPGIAELLAELTSNSLCVRAVVYDLRWITGEEKGDILNRFFNSSDIRTEEI